MQKGVYMSALKNKSLLIVAASMAMCALLSSCGTTFMVAADDVYGNMPTREQERRQRLEQQWRQSGQQPQETVSENTDYYSNQSTDTFNYDNYYDYEYSSRLRRFQNNDFVSNDYYSDYYTNSYWYDYNPWNYGTSIYLGYDWWYPRYTYYRPGWYLGFSYGPFAFSYGSYWDWGWRGYYPYWGYGSYYHGYNNGYWNGYWDGYWNGRYGNSYDYCYNPYDRNTYTQSYYGRRTRGSSITNPSVTSSSTRRVSSAMSSSTEASTPSLPAPTRRTFAERYESAVGSVSTSRTPVSGTEARPGTPKAEPTRRTTALTPSSMMENVSTRLSNKESVNIPVRRTTTTTNSAASGTPQRTGTATTPPATVRTPQVRPGQPAGNVNSGQPQQGTRTQQPQPRPYNTPVYDRSHSNSSYLSPRYNSTPRSSNSSSAPRSSSTVSAPRTSTTVSAPRTSTGSSAPRSSTSSSSGSSSRRTR